MSFSNPVAKSVGADGTAPGRVWESRLLPALITPNDGGWGVVCAWCGRTGTPPAFLFVCFVLLHRGFGVWVCVGGYRVGYPRRVSHRLVFSTRFIRE